LRIPRSLPNYRDLREELLHFHTNISGRSHTSYGSSRETVHDDLAPLPDSRAAGRDKN